jgi:hypothetical protein
MCFEALEAKVCDFAKEKYTRSGIPALPGMRRVKEAQAVFTPRYFHFHEVLLRVSSDYRNGIPAFAGMTGRSVGLTEGAGMTEGAGIRAMSSRLSPKHKGCW